MHESNKKLIMTALKEYGISEILGQGTNPRVLEYFKESGNEWVKNDETAWCSAFISFLAKQCNLARSTRLNARSWLEVGIEIAKPEIGDVVILWRISKTSPFGHVGLFVSEMGEYIFVLGGNQNNRVCIQAFLKSQVLGYRHIDEVVIQ